MMRIGILTWYKALNHGAILQAYALQQFISKKGYDVILLDYDRKVTNEKSIKDKIKRRLEKLFSGDYIHKKTYTDMNEKKTQLFNSFQKEYLKCGNKYDEETVDCLFIGSDMVFNLFQGYSAYMFGKGVNAKYKCTYAASAGGSDKQLAVSLGLADEISLLLNQLDGLGYRDRDTLKFITDLSGRTDCTENIDPVLLYGFENEKQEWDHGKWKEHEPFILIYSYHGNMNSKKEVQNIKSFAKSNNLKTVSGGYYHPWCDENINCDPREFIEMIKHARYVVTDTFHGTVFSLINKKAFCSIIRGNGFKLFYLLNECGLSNRIADQNTDVSSVLNSPIDYSSFDEYIKIARNKSNSYIEDQLERAKQR